MHTTERAARQARSDGVPGGLAQLGEHLLCKQGVVGSIPSSSTNQHTVRAVLENAEQSVLSNIKAASQKAALMLVHIDGPIGCSLKIYRVKSALLVETAPKRRLGAQTVPPATREKFLIASKRMFRLCLEIQN